MKTQAVLQPGRVVTPLRETDLWQHTAVRAPDRDVIPAAEAMTQTAVGHDFSALPARSSADRAQAACSLSSRTCPFGGACHACPVRVQAKLKVSQPDDEYEREADRVADTVMRMAEPEDQQWQTETAPPIVPIIQRETDDERETDNLVSERQDSIEEKDESEFLQMKERGNRAANLTPALISRIQGLRGGGKPLNEGQRAFFDSRFGRNFSKVRVYSSSQAAETARDIDARAYTVGQDIVFGEGQYTPETVQGRHLLAHELAHVQQQASSTNQPIQVAMRKPEQDPAVLNANIDEKDPELIWFTRPVTLDQAANYLWGKMPEEPDTIRPDPGEVAEAGKHKRFRVSVKNDISLAFTMRHGLADAYVRRLRPIRSKNRPIPPLEKQIPSWVSASARAKVIEMNEAGKFARDWPQVYTFPGEAPWGSIVLWVGPDEFDSTKPALQMFQYYPEDPAFYRKLRGWSDYKARLVCESLVIWNKDIKYYVERQKMRPSDARLEFQEQWTKLARMFIGAIGIAFGSAGGMGRPSESGLVRVPRHTPIPKTQILQSGMAKQVTKQAKNIFQAFRGVARSGRILNLRDLGQRLHTLLGQGYRVVRRMVTIRGKQQESIALISSDGKSSVRITESQLQGASPRIHIFSGKGAMGTGHGTAVGVPEGTSLKDILNAVGEP